MPEAPVDLWGPGAWALLHTCSFTYPESPTTDDRRQFHDFLWAVARVLPCPRCRKHFMSYLQTHAPAPCAAAFDDRKAISRLLVDVHNDVNRRTQKPEWTYAAARRRYSTEAGTVCPVLPPPAPCHAESPPAPCPAGPPALRVLLLLGLLLVMLALAARRRHRQPAAPPAG